MARQNPKAANRFSAFRLIADKPTEMAKEYKTKEVLDEALRAAKEIDDEPRRSKALIVLSEMLIKAGMSDKGKKALDEVFAHRREIKEEFNRSVTLAGTAIGFANLQLFHLARITADLCPQTGDKLQAYAAILTEYAKTKDIKLRQRLESEKSTEYASIVRRMTAEFE